MSPEAAPLVPRKGKDRPTLCMPFWIAMGALAAVAVLVPIVIILSRPPNPPSPPAAPPLPPAPPPPPFSDPLCSDALIKGIGFGTYAWNDQTVPVLRRLRCLGGNTVMLRIGCWQPDLRSTSPKCLVPWSGADAVAITELLERGRCVGLKFALQTELHAANEGAYSSKYERGVWAADIGGDALGDANFTAAEWQAWAKAWEAQVVPWAAWAQAHQIALLSIGAELTNAQRRAEIWKPLIAAVKAKYTGQLTYGADKLSEGNVSWWGEMDYVRAVTRSPSPPARPRAHSWLPLDYFCHSHARRRP